MAPTDSVKPSWLQNSDCLAADVTEADQTAAVLATATIANVAGPANQTCTQI
ncbi:MAG: hypothetical protein ABJZ55_04590 [Fuerstiella sp.]